MKKSRLWLGLCALALQGTTAAGEASAGANERTVDERVTVIATKAPRNPSETGAQVTVISRDEIERKGAVFAIDVLKDVPGVYVTQAGGPGGQATVRLRGEEGYRTLLLIDGMKVSDTAAPQVLFNFADLLAGDIERIEILRGPQALLYGADAIGGVIAISTRRGGKAREMGLSFEGGSFSTADGSAYARGALGAFDYALSASGYADTGISAKSGAGFAAPDPYRNGTLHAVLGLTIDDLTRAEAVLRYVASRAAFDGFATEDDVQYTDHVSGRVALTSRSADGRWSGVAAANYMAQDRAVYENGAPWIFGARYDSKRWRLEALSRYKIADRHEIVVGTDYEDERAVTDTLSRRRDDVGVLAEYQGAVSQDAFLTAGLRFDRNGQFGDHLSWRVTAAQQIAKTDAYAATVKASAGSGFRAPSLYELYDAFSGDPTLHEETGLGWDIGFDVDTPEMGLTATVAYFDQRIEDEIRFDPLAFVYVQNPSTTTSRGVEVGLSGRLWEALKASVSYTYNDARIASLDAENGLPRLRRPRGFGSVSLDYDFDEGRGSLNATLQMSAKQQDGFFVTRTTLSGYAVVSLNARYAVVDGVILTLRGQNILDERYEVASGYNTPRAGLFAGVDLRF